MGTFKEMLTATVAIARGAGEILREGFGQAHRIDFKGSIDLVTEYDRRSEAYILRELHERFPDHAVLAEESGGRASSSEFRWLVDPLDGTTNFSHGLPVFAVSIGLARHGRMLLGAVYDPVREEMFTGLAGEGVALNDRPIRTSAIAVLDRSLLVTGFPYDLRTNPDNNLRHFARLSYRTQAVRRLGSAALDLAYVAAGHFDGYWEFRLNPWDIGAGALLVMEAGGRVTDAQAGEDYLSGRSIVATNGLIHEELLRELNAAGEA